MGSFLKKLGLVLVTLLVWARPVKALVYDFNLVWEFVRAGTSNGYLTNPRGVHIASSGNIYVSEESDRIQIFDTNGTYVAKFGSLGTGNGQFNNPYDVTVDASGNIYVADTSNHRIQKFNSSYTWQWTVGGTASGTGNTQFNLPRGIATDGTKVYVADTSNNRISIFQASDGAFVSNFGSNGTGDGQFSSPYGIDVDSSGNIWVADRTNDRVQKFNNSGTFLLKFGVDGTGPGQFKFANDVAVDDSGNVFVADSSNYRIQKLTGTGTYLTEYSTNNTPYGVDVDSSNVVAFHDTTEHFYKTNFTAEKYQVSNLDTSLNVVNATTGVDLETGSNYGVTSATARLEDSNGLVISDVGVTFSADVDWSGVSGDSDRAAGKSVVSGIVSATGTASTHTLYVPVPEGKYSSSVYICPDATVIGDVSTSCTNGVSRGAGGPYVESFGTITVSYIDNLGDNVTYWKIEGMEGSGGEAELAIYSGSGSGTSGDPYQIDSCTELQEMEYDRAAYYQITGNVDCTGTTAWNGGNGFVPVGASLASPFTGNLTGSSSYAINGLYINMTHDGIGLFGYTNGATITDVYMTNLNYEKDATEYQYIGGLIGYMTGGTISGANVAGAITQTANSYNWTYRVGGMAGVMASNASISGSTTGVNITMREEAFWTGGMVGEMNDTSSVTNSHATGKVWVGHGSYDNGGFVGAVYDSATITTSDSSGEVKIGAPSTLPTLGSFDNGGFAGVISGTAPSITNSYSTSNVVIVLLDDDTSQVWDVGGFVGLVDSGATIDNCYSTGTITLDNSASDRGGYYTIGGFAGLMRNQSSPAPTITNSYSTGPMLIDQANGGSNVGGFIGEFRYGTISDSYSTRDITIQNDDGTDFQYTNSVGGFVGQHETDGTITKCYATGDVTGEAATSSVGGFVGMFDGTTVSTISESWSSGNVIGNDLVGGFVGFVQTSTGSIIKNSYSRGNAYSYNADGYISVGGFGGYVRTVDFENTYSTGTASALNETGSDIGGYIGYDGGVTVTSSYWDTQTSGEPTSPEGTGLTTAQMKTQSSYLGWDFGTIWEFVSGQNDGYPVLQFQSLSGASPSPSPSAEPEAQTETTTTTAATGGINTDCGALMPLFAPDLFSAIRKGNRVTLSYVPVAGPVTGYTVMYGYYAGDERYSASFNQGYSTGALDYEISKLEPKQPYTFWMRAYNDCVPGPWSDYIDVGTTNQPKPTPTPTPPPSPTPSPEPVEIDVVVEEPVEVPVEIVVEDVIGVPVEGAEVEVLPEGDGTPEIVSPSPSVEEVVASSSPVADDELVDSEPTPTPTPIAEEEVVDEPPVTVEEPVEVPSEELVDEEVILEEEQAASEAGMDDEETEAGSVAGTTNEDGIVEVILPVGGNTILITYGDKQYQREIEVTSDGGREEVSIPILQPKDAPYVAHVAAATAGVGAAAAAAVATVGASTLITSAMAPIYTQTARSIVHFPLDLLTNLLKWFLRAFGSHVGLMIGWVGKRKKKAGLVFDALGQKPLAGAYVVFYSKSGNLKSDFTDYEGRYVVEPRPDSYELRVEKKDFRFPSKIFTVSESTRYAHVYTAGEVFEVTEEGMQIDNVAVPMDPRRVAKRNAGLRRALVKTSYFLTKLRTPALAVGIVVAMLAAYFERTALNGAILGSSVLYWGWEILYQKRLAAIGKVIS